MRVFVCFIFVDSRLLAVAEKGKKPSISIYDLVTFKLKRHLMLEHARSNSFIKLKFTFNDAYLAALSGEPDYTMYYYDWRNSKITSFVHVIYSPNIGPVYDVFK